MRIPWGYALWFLIYLFPFAMLGLARNAARLQHQAPPAFWPLLFFYGAAAAVTLIVLFTSRLFFRTLPASHDRVPMVKFILLIPLVPGIIYIGMFALRFLTLPQPPAVQESPAAPHPRIPDAAAGVPQRSSMTAPDGTTHEPPTITLNGPAAVDMAQGAFWQDPGASALDASGADLTDKIAVTGKVDTNKAGLYTLTYSVVDSMGGSASVSRLVHVSAPSF